MNNRLPVACLVAINVVLAAVAVVLWRRQTAAQAAPEVTWYNTEFRKTFGEAPGGMTFAMGARQYELGVRADGVVIARAVDSKKPLAQTP